jgi:hypothetical protein
MTANHEIPLFSWVELTEPIGLAPAGARGGLLEYYGDDRAMVEVMEPDLDSVDRIVFPRVDTLRACEPRRR